MTTPTPIQQLFNLTYVKNVGKVEKKFWFTSNKNGWDTKERNDDDEMKECSLREISEDNL
jgi:hypothetical protein